MIRRMTVVAALTALLCMSAVADLAWFNSRAIKDQNNIPVAAHSTDYTVGFFAQLVFTGIDGTKDDFVASGTGTTDDDVVVATMFAGQDDFIPQNGFYPVHTGVVGPANGDYYVRVYNAANPNYPSGALAAIPPAATYYWESIEHSYIHNDSEVDNCDFSAGSSELRTLNPISQIPEPAMFGLALVSIGALRLYRSKKA